jgi:4-azaleucine resistance transporter AzlC
MSVGSRAASAAPVVLAVTGFGLPYGVLASAAGFPEWLTVVMSLTVFAGSSQFAAVSVLGAGGSPVAAIVSGALLNSRYLATGTAAARVLPGGRARKFLLAQLVVDESYALGVGAGRAGEPDASMMVRSGVALWVGWALGSAAGALVGPVLGDPETLGLDAAFPALFVALLWPLLRGGDDDGAGTSPRAATRTRRVSPAVLAALTGALTALVLTPIAGAGVALAGAAFAGLLVYR